MTSNFKKLGLASLALGGILVASIALANIIAGQSTTAISINVTHSEVELSKPSGTTQGDLLLAGVSVNGGSNETITPPDGWSLVTRTNNGTNISLASYKKIAGASEPSSYTWIISSPAKATGGVTRYSGVDAVSSIDVMGSSTGHGTSATAPSVTTTTANDQVVALFAVNHGTGFSSFFGTTPGMTKRYDVKNTPSGPTSAAEDKVQAAAGASGTFASSFSNFLQYDWAAQTITLRPASPSTLNSGLVSYWKLDEASGNAADSKGTNTLTNVNSVVYDSSGQIHNAADFEKDVPQQSLEISDAAQTGLDFSQNMSISMWLKPESNPDPSNPGGADDGWWELASKDAWNGTTPPTPNRAFALYYIPKEYQSVGVYRLALYAFSSDGGLATVYFEADLGTSSWRHIVATWDGTQTGTANKIKVYVDGALANVSSVYQAGPEVTAMPNSNASFKLGTDSLANRYHVDGMMDEVGVWSRTLTSGEVTELFNDGIAGKQYPF